MKRIFNLLEKLLEVIEPIVGFAIFTLVASFAFDFGDNQTPLEEIKHSIMLLVISVFIVGDRLKKAIVNSSQEPK